MWTVIALPGTLWGVHIVIVQRVLVALTGFLLVGVVLGVWYALSTMWCICNWSHSLEVIEGIVFIEGSTWTVHVWTMYWFVRCVSHQRSSGLWALVPVNDHSYLLLKGKVFVLDQSGPWDMGKWVNSHTPTPQVMGPFTPPWAFEHGPKLFLATGLRIGLRIWSRISAEA